MGNHATTESTEPDEISEFFQVSNRIGDHKRWNHGYFRPYNFFWKLEKSTNLKHKNINSYLYNYNLILSSNSLLIIILLFVHPKVLDFVGGRYFHVALQNFVKNCCSQYILIQERFAHQLEKHLFFYLLHFKNAVQIFHAG